MLDVYTDRCRTRARSSCVDACSLPGPSRGGLRGDKLVVLKRFKSFSRGGDELQIYDLR